MSTTHKIIKAQSIIDSLQYRDLESLKKTCIELQDAQNKLIKKGTPYFQYCQQHCSGMCCRNIHVDDIITLLDFVFILTLNPKIFEKALASARKESMFTSDCLFLANGSGPCMFAANQKPERCIITFCQDTGPLKNEIKKIRKQFNRILRLIVLKRPTKFFGF